MPVCCQSWYLRHVVGVTHTHDHILDVLNTGDVICIMQEGPAASHACLYGIKGNRSGDLLRIYTTLDLLNRST